MKKKLFLLIMFIVFDLLVVDYYGTAFVSNATDLESQTNKNVSNTEKREDNTTEEVNNLDGKDDTKDIKDNEESNSSGESKDESTILEDMEDKLDIHCNEITIKDIKNLKIFNKYGKALTVGDEGKLVESLHILLRWLNYDVDDTSSVFTLQTKQAVIKFQEDHSMKGIGIVDKLTYIRLNDFIHSSKIEYDYIEYDVKMGPTEDYWIIINKTTNVLQLYKGKNRLNIYPIATGRYSSFTPEGKFEIANKLVNAAWKDVPGGVASNPLGSRWMGISVGNYWTYGIHGCGRPESIGSYASAGCIRMYNFQSEELYNLVPVHTPVWIGTTDKIEEWIMELNRTFDEMQKEQEETKLELYDEVMALFLKPHINEALANHYGELYSSYPKTVDIISVNREEEQEHVVTITLEVSVNNKTDDGIEVLLEKEQVTISIDLNETEVEVVE